GGARDQRHACVIVLAHSSAPSSAPLDGRVKLGAGTAACTAACELAVRSCLPWVHAGRGSRALHARRGGGPWSSALPACSNLPRKRTTSTSTSVTSSRSNTILGPLLSICACKASRCAACRWPISRSVVWCPSVCRSILHVICAVSFLSSVLSVPVDE